MGENSSTEQIAVQASALIIIIDRNDEIVPPTAIRKDASR
jgi:hypothetical protein